MAGLTLNNNRLTELPATIFNGVTRGEARIVTLFNNPWTPGTGLPAGIFDGIVNGFTTTNEGILNGLAVDDAVRAAHFVCSLPDAALIVAAFPSTIPTATTEDHCPLVTSAQLDAFIQMDTSLSALGISAGTLVPDFDRAINAYTVAVQNSVASVTITPTANQGNAAITVEGEDVNSGSASDPLLLTEGTPLVVDIEVTALDGSTTGAHTVTVTRAATGGASAALSGTITEANLFAGAAVATMTLTDTGFESGVAPADFGISDNIDGDLSITGVTVADGSTLTATIMLTHSGGDITSGELSITLLDSGHTGSGNLPAGTLAITASAGAYVCDRTAAVRDAITTASADEECTGITDLADITALDLSNRGIIRLQDGDLDGLDALATLALAGNPFTAAGLPAGIFDGVLNTLGDVGTAFTVDNAVRQAHFICSRADGGAIVSVTAGVTDCLRITEAQLSAFPAIDASLSALTLSVGDLMPSFDPATTNYNVGVGDVESVTVTPTANQSGATITVNGADVDSGSASVAVTLTANMPETITIQVTATDTSTTRDYVVTVTREGASATLTSPLTERILFSASPSGRRAPVTLERTQFVAAADLGPDDFMVTETIDGTLSVASVSGGGGAGVSLLLEHSGDDITADGVYSITVLASAHTGSGDLITNTQPITASAGANVCRRTVQIRDEIINQSSATECTSITDLATITSIVLVNSNIIDLRNGNFAGLITSLQSGDFAGMSGLTALVIFAHPFTTLPADIFSDLTALTGLNLGNNILFDTLPPNVFAGLSALEELSLNDNILDTLPPNIFAGLAALTDLSLSDNNLPSLPANIFDGLDSLVELVLSGNPYTADTGLPAGIFDDVVDTLGPIAATGSDSFLVDDSVRNAHFVCSSPLADLIVAATSDADDCLLVTSAQLTAFGMVDTSLSALTVSDGILTPAFDPTVDTYTVAVQLGVTSVTITPTANQSGATITVAGTPVPSGSSIAVPASPDALTAGLGLAIAIEVTAPDTTTTDIYTVTATRGGPGMTPPRADVSGTITESDLFAGTAVVTMTLRETEFVAAADLMPDDFGLSDTVEGDLSIAGVTRDSTTAATIMLAHSGEDITAGELILDLLATGHTGSGTLPAGSVDVTVSDGAYVCDRTAAVRDAITTASAGDDCTNITDLDTITALDLSNQGINRLQDGDLDGLDALATLALAGNPFTAGGLPAGIFDDVVDTLGDVGTAFTVDNAVRQAHFICSRADGGAIVAATAGVTDCLRITEAQLSAFPAIDASLSALTLSAGDLMPSFDPAITNYNVGVDAGSVTVTPTANQSGATISVNGATVASGSASVAVPLVANTPAAIMIQVTATDTSTSRDYVVMVTRGGAVASLETSAPLTEESLFSFSFRRPVQVILERTEFVAAADLTRDDFMVTDTLDGTVSVTNVGTPVVRTDATNATVTIEYTGEDITTDGTISLTVLASAHTGSGDLLTNTLPITASNGVNVCDRTPQVRSTLVNTSSATECTSITDLATITQLVLNGQGIPALRSGDFAGMSGLTNLQMNNNRFTTLPADIFSGLTALDRLTMRTGQLTTLPPGIFAGLTALDRLEMNGNRLETLPVGIFSDLSALDRLFLQANRFASLDTGVFDGLNMITDLSLTANPFTPGTGLPAGIFDDILDTAVGLGIQIGAAGVAAHFVCSLPIADLVVAATAGVDFCQFISTEQLTNFAMVDTSLSALTISSGDALIPGFAPGVTAYTVGVLNRFDPITVTPTASQPGAMITVQGNDVNSGSASAAIMLDEGTPVPIEIIVTAPDTTTMQTITVTATREGAPTAELAGTLTEANLFAATAPTVTVTLTGTDYVEAGELMPDDFAVTDGLTDGTVSITEVARTSNRVATLTLGYDDMDITADGTLSVTVLAAGHSDMGDLDAGMIDITASAGTNVCGRTAQVVAGINALTGSECTNADDLATITGTLILGDLLRDTPLQSGDFAGLSGITALILAAHGISSLPPGVFADLSGLTILQLDGNVLTSLNANIFDGLESLERLTLNSNMFTPGTGLPAGVFDDILDTLDPIGAGGFSIDNNVRAAHFICIRDDADAIVAFTSGVDDCLRISTADLNAFFASDATLSALTISDGALSPAFNPATITYTVAVLSGVENVMVTPTASQSSSAIITVAGATVASGATSNAIAVAEGTMAIPIVVTPPDGMSSMVTYTINVTRPAMGGATAVLAGTLTEANLFARAATATVTLMGTEYVSGLSADDFTLSADVPGTVSLMSVVRTSTTVATLTLSHSGGDIIAADGELMMNLLASGHTGATALATNGLVITPSDGMNICDRTEAVRDAIVDGSPAAVCTDVTDSDLASITSLDLSGGVVTTLQSGDFAGLTALTSLNLSGDLFNQANRLSALPADIFAGLTALQTLNLSNNNLTTLDANQFAGLTMLTSLNLTSNSLAALDAGQFTGLTMLTDLNLQGNNINALDAGQFTGLTALTSLDLQNNPLGALDAGQFTGLTALETLGLRSTQLDELDAGQFADLSALMILDLARNNLGELDANQFADLTGLTDLFLNSNALASLPPTIFADLSALRILQLSNNGLTALDADQFDGLTRLDLLNLGSNQFTTLPADLFDGLERLTTLSLQFINTFTPATGLPAGIFDDVLDTLGGIGTAFEVDADARAAHFVCSRGDADVVVAATTNVDDCLRITDMQLTAFASTDASLSELTLSDGDLVPAFDPAITDYTVAVADDVAMVTVTPTARQTSATITVNDADVNSGEASAAIMLTAGTPAVFTVVVTATDGAATTTYAVMVTRGGATATLAGTVDEAALFATPAPTVTVTLLRSEYAGTLVAGNFMLSDTIDGTVSITGVARTSTTVATLTLGYDNVDITANGELFLTVLATGHTGSVNLFSLSLPIAQSSGANVCGRTAEVRDRIVAASSASDECTSITDLATITTLDLDDMMIATLQSGDFAGLSGLTIFRLAGNSLTTLPDGVFNGLSAVTLLSLRRNQISTLDANAFSGLPALITLNLEENELTALDPDLFDGLPALFILNLENNDLTALDADLFDGLPTLTNMNLRGNDFTAGTGLPAGVFDDVLDTLGSVGTLDGGNNFVIDDTVRAAHFVCSRDDFAAIVTATTGVTDCLRITSTQLNTFVQADTGLSALTISAGALSPPFDPATDAYNVAVLNSVESVTVTPTARQSSATITVQTMAVTSGSASDPFMLTAGTPLAINIVVTARDGSTMGTYTVTVSRPAMGGATAVLAGTLTEANLFARAATATVTLMGTEYVSGLSEADFTLSADVPGTVELVSVVRTSTTVATLTLSHSGGDIIAADGELMMNLLASGHTGATALATNGLTIAPSDGMNICDRTEAVRDAILDGFTATVCADVSVAQLASITSLDLSSSAIPALQSGDFAGLSGLTSLNLNDDGFTPTNSLSPLPADIFAGLTALQTLTLINNDLTTLDANQFAGLSALTILDLRQNSITALPAGLFTGLTALEELRLGGNQIAALDAAQFAGLSALQNLRLDRNRFTALDADQFAGLTALTNLSVDRNQLTALDADQFDGLTALTILSLNGNQFATLPADLFDGLDALGNLNLNENQFATLPADLFDGLDALGALDLTSNPFTADTGLPVGIFDDVIDSLLATFGGNFLIVDTVGRFAHFVCSRADANAVVAATAGVDNCIFISSAQLNAFVNTDASLTELTISDGALVPAFDPAIFAYTVAVANDVATVTVTPTARQTVSTITVNGLAVNSGEASLPITLTLNTPEDVPVVVTTGDGSTERTYTIMVTPGGATATLRAVNSLTEQGLFAGQINFRAVRVDLERTEFVDAADLTGADFTVSDTLDGTVSLASDVRRDSDILAFLVLEYSGEDITADGTLSVTVLESAHTRSGDLRTNTVPVTASAGANVCGRTPAVVAEIVTRSTNGECTNITDLATITNP